MKFGPAPTSYGTILIQIEAQGGKVAVRWEARWRGKEPVIELRFPGKPGVVAEKGKNKIEISHDLLS